MEGLRARALERACVRAGTRLRVQVLLGAALHAPAWAEQPRPHPRPCWGVCACSPLSIPAPPTQRTQLPPARVQHSARGCKLPLHIQSAVSARLYCA